MNNEGGFGGFCSLVCSRMKCFEKVWCGAPVAPLEIRLEPLGRDSPSPNLPRPMIYPLESQPMPAIYPDVVQGSSDIR